MDKKIKTSSLYYMLSIWVIGIYIFIAIFAPLLANEKPLYVSINGKSSFPAFSNDPYFNLPDGKGGFEKILSVNVDWKNLNAQTLVFPVIPWSPDKSDLLNSYASPFGKQYFIHNGKQDELPFRFRHLLGTGKAGNDVLSGLIHGCRTSITIGLFSVIIALVIGIFLGALSGYFGDDRLSVQRGSVLLSVSLLIPAFFYSFYLRADLIQTSLSSSLPGGCFQLMFSMLLFLLIICWPFAIQFRKIPFLEKRIYIRVDSLISRTMEVFLSLPRLILILSIAAVIKPSITTIILIIGLTSWTDTARIVRAGVLSIRETNYISAAKALGIGNTRIFIFHFLPNIVSQIFIIGIFGMASAIMSESSLSFLGVGLQSGISSWGNLMYQARENFQAWWLVVFSGSAIFILIITLNKLGNVINLITKR